MRRMRSGCEDAKVMGGCGCKDKMRMQRQNADAKTKKHTKMIITVKRIACKDKYTIGRMSVDGKYFCDTLEPPLTGRSHPAIPTGKYRVTLGIKSPRYSNFSRYPWAEDCGGMLPRLIGVPGREGILIHVGNVAEDTLGCILVGQNKIKGRVLNSAHTFHTLYDMLKTDRDNLEIEIQ